MADHGTTLDEVLSLARRLRPSDQARLIVRLAPTIEHLVDQRESTSAPSSRPRLRGLLADLGPAPSAEEITDVQREMWAPVAGEPG
jgi:hypothetical protein